MLMSRAYFRFYEELNDFLPAGGRNKLFSYEFYGKPSIKDSIEAIGIPHEEADLVLVNSLSVDFSYKLKNADSVSVYPVFKSFDTYYRPDFSEQKIINLSISDKRAILPRGKGNVIVDFRK
jgi:hypothetical protein